MNYRLGKYNFILKKVRFAHFKLSDRTQSAYLGQTFPSYIWNWALICTYWSRLAIDGRWYEREMYKRYAKYGNICVALLQYLQNGRILNDMVHIGKSRLEQSKQKSFT